VIARELVSCRLATIKTKVDCVKCLFSRVTVLRVAWTPPSTHRTIQGFRYGFPSENGMRKRVSGQRLDNKRKEMIGLIESPSPFLWSETASDIGDWLNV